MTERDCFILIGIGGFFIFFALILFLWGKREEKSYYNSLITRIDLREYLEPQAKTLEYIVYGGARTTLQSLQKHCPFLQQFDNRLLPPLLDIPPPHRAVLEAAVSRVWSSRIYEWYEAPPTQG